MGRCSGRQWGSVIVAEQTARMPDVDPEHEDLINSALGRYLTQRSDEDFLPLARQCYENVLAKHPAFESNAVVDFEIIGDPSGPALVDKAELKQRENKTEPEFSTCLREPMMTLRLDEPPEEMERISASFQFGFSPHEKD
jgi:hypothetical protein